MYQWSPLFPQPLWWVSSHSSVSSEQFIFYFRFSLSGLKLVSSWEWELVSRNGKEGFPHSSNDFSEVCIRTSHFLADQHPLVVIQVFYILHPRAWMFPQLWKAVSQHTLKWYSPLPELASSEGFEVLAGAHGYMGWQCLHILALQQGCNEQTLSRGVWRTQQVDRWLWAVGGADQI